MNFQVKMPVEYWVRDSGGQKTKYGDFSIDVSPWSSGYNYKTLTI